MSGSFELSVHGRREVGRRIVVAICRPINPRSAAKNRAGRVVDQGIACQIRLAAATSFPVCAPPRGSFAYSISLRTPGSCRLWRSAPNFNPHSFPHPCSVVANQAVLPQPVGLSVVSSSWWPAFSAGPAVLGVVAPARRSALRRNHSLRTPSRKSGSVGAFVMLLTVPRSCRRPEQYGAAAGRFVRSIDCANRRKFVLLRSFSFSRTPSSKIRVLCRR